MPSIQSIPYTLSDKAAWDNFVSLSRNATFLFYRDFMDYHADRFVDASLMFLDSHGRLKGLLPASWHEGSREIRSHGGLTYGGLLLSPTTHAHEVAEMLLKARDYYRSTFAAERMLIRHIPSIYHKMPSDDELYWGFRLNMQLVGCALSSTVELHHQAPFATLRRRGMLRAKRFGLSVEEASKSKDWEDFWSLLTDVLTSRHGRKPVHNVEEIMVLKGRFPQNIRLKIVRSKNAIIGGTVLFCAPPVVHAQYIAASDLGCEQGALDLLFYNLLQEYSQSDTYRYFDFGISTEKDGHYLNKGLNAQKEGFGARSTVYNTFAWEFS